ncbi:MAG: LysM peptidoglycan-binding domain-containing protein [Acidimicrobiaceae bacterium]|jgi:LysM repeat protein|nr:LysM peptidoglycan-binding domain-containing protein [Ilumatobacteraceae bacterium]NQW33953.1 LysM peptidoglycan-binding domain-containing protein [Acidimicrobiaceae bacterium]
MLNRNFKSIFVSLIVAAFVLTSCGVDVSGSATTVVPIGPTDFATIPPVQTTLPNTTTTLPPGAVGVEQIYTVQAGDSPNLVANLFGITVTELLAWNGLISATQFPYAGRKLRIPPSAQVVSSNVQQTTVANVVGKPGCGNRPAGTYEIAQGDSLFVIIKKFCVSMTALLAANQWSSVDVFIYQGMKVNIPAAGT